MNISQVKLQEALKTRQHIYLDNDGFLFDNTKRMNDAAVFTLKEVFGVDPLTLPRSQVLANLKKFYKQNPQVFNRVPWVAGESMALLDKEIEEYGEESLVSEFDIFRMSSRAYGGAFLYGSNTDIFAAYDKFVSLLRSSGLGGSVILNKDKVEEAIELFKSNIEAIVKKPQSNISPISKEAYVSGGVTSRTVFEAYLGIYFAIFEPQVSPLDGAYDLVKTLSKFCNHTRKGFGIISNRSADSLLPLLKRHRFINATMLNEKFIIPADPVLGGKPRLHQFRQVIPQKETLLYFGDLPTDVEVTRELNRTDGKGTAMVVVIPTDFEYSLDANGNDSNTFDPLDREHALCLTYPQILHVVHAL